MRAKQDKVAAIMLFTLLSLATHDRASAGSFVYVSNIQSGTVSAIDTTTNTVAATIPIGGELLGIASSPRGQYVYVGGFGGKVSIIDVLTNSVAATIAVGSQPREITFSPDGAFAYVTDQGLNVVWVIDTATRLIVGSPIPVGNGATAIGITPDGAFVYVVNVCGAGSCFPMSRGTVSIIDTNSRTVTNTIPLGYRPNGIAIAPDGAFAYVANQCGEDLSCASEGTVSVISTATQAVARDIPVGQFISQFIAIATSPDGRLAYVSNTCGDAPTPCPLSGGTVSIIDTTTNRVIASPIPVGAFPGELAVTRDGMFVYVANQCGNTSGCGSGGSVSVIATTTRSVVATIPVGGHPAFLTIVSSNAPPDCSVATPLVTELRSPNHKLVSIPIGGITDPDGDLVTVAVTGITQDEPSKAPGSGVTCPDASGVGASTPQVRAERDGSSDGRVYHISFRATDSAGNSCAGTVTVCVPNDQSGPGPLCVDEGPRFDSTGPC